MYDKNKGSNLKFLEPFLIISLTAESSTRSIPKAFKNSNGSEYAFNALELSYSFLFTERMYSACVRYGSKVEAGSFTL